LHTPVEERQTSKNTNKKWPTESYNLILSTSFCHRDWSMSHLDCSTVFWMQIGVAGFAILAAALWFVSSLVKMPSTALDKLILSDMGKISEAFGRQSRWNAGAALCAAIAAVLQAFLVFAPSCLNLG
jgi:hypothetical protein